MCGLVGIFSKKNKHAGRMVIDKYNNQKNRGQSGFGYVAIDDGHIVSVKRAKEEKEMLSLLNKEEARFILFHHRQPTSTSNTLGTTHPIFIQNKELQYDYYVAHNGIINNHLLLKKRHEELGYKYTTEHTLDTIVRYSDGRVEHSEAGQVVKSNDSEALAIEFARHIEGLSPRIGAVGSVALWAVQVEKGGTKVVSVFFGKNYGRPLKEIDNKKCWGFSSVTGKDLPEMILHKLKMDTWSIEETDFKICEDKPPVGFKTQTTYTAPELTRYDLKTKYSTGAYDSLDNKHYTYNEAIDTGFPLTDFFTTKVGNITFYVPIKFAGDLDFRKTPGQLSLPSPYQLPDPETYLTDKQRDRLETLALEFAEIEVKIDEDGDSEENREEMSRLSIRAQQIEEDIAAMGIDQDVAEQALELARDIVLNY